MRQLFFAVDPLQLCNWRALSRYYSNYSYRREGGKEREGGREAKRGRPLGTIEEDHRFWAKERAWIEARDVALVEALERLSGLVGSSSLVTNQRASQKGEA